MNHVVFYETFEEEQAALKRHLPDAVTASFVKEPVHASGHAAPPARLISIRTQSVIPKHWLPDLAGVLSRSSGFDHLQTLSGQSEGRVACGYLPLYCVRAVAEQALLMLLALNRNLKGQLRQFNSFDRDNLTGTDCLNQKLLVLGVGNIGQEVVHLARAVGMQVRGFDQERKLANLDYLSLEEGIRFAQSLVCTLPLTKQTLGLLDYALLKQARPGTVLINLGRGEITPTADLKRLLDERILGGLGLDVFEEETDLSHALLTKRPPKKPSGQLVIDLKGRDNVLFTPHNAFNTRQAVERKAQQSGEAVTAFLKNGRFPQPIPNAALKNPAQDYGTL